MMALYFMHLHDGVDEYLDDYGAEYRSQSAARTAAVEGLRDIVSSQAIDGVIDTSARINVRDADGHDLFEVNFADAVQLSMSKKVG